MASRASLIASLKSRRDTVVAQIASLAADGLDLPNVTGDGVNPDFDKYKRGLYDELKALELALSRLDVGIVNSRGA